MARVFSKDKWLRTANEQKARGILNQKEIDDALEIWVNNLDGKTYEEINGDDVRGRGQRVTREDWFVETT